MGATESIHNDTAESVEVWWQGIGGAGTTPKQMVKPDGTTPPQKFTLSLDHELCVKYGLPGKMTNDIQTCINRDSPAIAGRHITYDVSAIIGEDALLRIGATPKITHESTQFGAPLLFALGSATIAVLRFRSLKKKGKDSTEEPLVKEVSAPTAG
eukprot:gnl/MRDRNA2_/MRDRNA2_25599_c0_seq1.p1 gnl/MRDRNA2_/MRDRNA2_25599_c0~~gnl/MRDRNA2_/MRDRNA2_25599_c0_seq1.p1  ORF type:complete len:155 (-),score=24.39 gnl/MRDRNA2_/MRDRNA2_25599_c0_seq1:92-556(-)